PCAYRVWLTSSFIIISWLTGTRAIRSSRTSVRSTSWSAGGASSARPHSTASRPDSESPVNNRRLARCAPTRCAHSAVVGEPHTRIERRTGGRRCTAGRRRAVRAPVRRAAVGRRRRAAERLGALDQVIAAAEPRPLAGEHENVYPRIEVGPLDALGELTDE